MLSLKLRLGNFFLALYAGVGLLILFIWAHISDVLNLSSKISLIGVISGIIIAIYLGVSYFGLRLQKKSDSEKQNISAHCALCNFLAFLICSIPFLFLPTVFAWEICYVLILSFLIGLLSFYYLSFSFKRPRKEPSSKILELEFKEHELVFTSMILVTISCLVSATVPSIVAAYFGKGVHTLTLKLATYYVVTAAYGISGVVGILILIYRRMREIRLEMRDFYAKKKKIKAM